MDRCPRWSLLFLFIFSCLCSGPLQAAHKELSNPKASEEARAVYAYLSALEGRGILAGQQETPRGDGELGEEIAYIRSKTGREPALLGLDFLTYAGVTEKAKAWWKRDGLVTICWHWGAPGFGPGFESSEKRIDIEEALRPGTPTNRILMADLERCADELQKLRDAHVPVLWRPLHEFNGNWFWWSKGGPESFKHLWVYMYDYFTNTRHLDNLIWVLGYTSKADAAWYPGDHYVDIAGADNYACGVQAGMYDAVQELTRGRLPLAYHECGPIPDPDFLASAGPEWVWFLTWHTKHIREQNQPEELRRVYNHPYVITLDRLPKWKNIVHRLQAHKPLNVPFIVSKYQPDSLAALSWVAHPAEEAAFRYEGRIDHGNPHSRVLIWQGSRVSFRFEGKRLQLYFGPTTGQSYYDLVVDGQRVLVSLTKEGYTSRFEYPLPLATGLHSATLTKRSEADAGYAAFEGVGLEPQARLLPLEFKPAAEEAYLFFGDSITVGACNEDGAEDQWENRSTHNNALSYGALTAQAMKADYRNIAVSGMGIRIGYVDKIAAQIWNRLYPRPDAPIQLEAGWVPTHIFINYGENDDSFSKSHNQSFPADFSEGYVALVREIRKAYPQAWITLLRGGMAGGATSPVLREAWEKAVTLLEAEDKRLDHFVFKHWSGLHPRVADDQAMASELVSKLQSSPRNAR